MFPKPKFEIGQIVRIKHDDDPDMFTVVKGIEINYYEHLRRHVWYYHLCDTQNEEIGEFTGDQIEAAAPQSPEQEWWVTGGNVPTRECVVCWNCNEVRINDELDCPYCEAEYKPPSNIGKEEACKIARDLSLDDAIRTIVRAGRRRGHDYYTQFAGMSISATFGAGTNSANVSLPQATLYQASDYGRHIEVFRYGPWVHRLLFEAGKIRQTNDAQREADEANKATQEGARFQEVDF